MRSHSRLSRLSRPASIATGVTPTTAFTSCFTASFTAALLGLLLASPATAQQQCIATHDDGTLVSNVSTGGVPIAYKLQAPQAMTIVAIQLHTGLRTGAGSVAIWDHDPVANAPNALVGGKGVYNQRSLEGWQGAVLPQPVMLLSGQDFWMVWEAPNSSRTNWSTDPNGTVYYRGFINGAWNGPAQGWGPKPVKLRLYCDHQAGPVNTIGVGQAGSGGFVPTLTLEGWPAPGNAMELVLEKAQINAQAVLLIGQPASLPIGIGTAYVLPLVSVVVPTSSGRGPGEGAATLELRSPPNPALAGVSLAFQYWVLDPGAATGFSHTDGLVITFR